MFLLFPSIRLAVCCEHTIDELTQAVSVLKGVIERNIKQ